MTFIRYVRIENFRSIGTVTFDGLDDYNPILGLNSAGKSNILRALNLFFNGFVDEDSNALDLSADFTSHAPKRKKRVVSVTVGFGIGGKDLHVRGQEEFQNENGISDVVYIRRSWSLSSDALGVEDSFSFGATLDMRDAEPHEIASLLAHIRSVRYVYIPNHTRPAELIRSELAPLRPTLVARLRATKAYRDSKVSDVLTNLTRDCPDNGVSGSTRRPAGLAGRVADDRDTCGREPI